MMQRRQNDFFLRIGQCGADCEIKHAIDHLRHFFASHGWNLQCQQVRRENESAMYQIFQFAHITGPAIAV